MNKLKSKKGEAFVVAFFILTLGAVTGLMVNKAVNGGGLVSPNWHKTPTDDSDPNNSNSTTAPGAKLGAY